MTEFEEETYSTVFAALKHPTRRKILRILSEGPRSFTDMQNSFKVNSPFLTYHLESLKDLVSKTENGKYRLSSMGEGAGALMERVEEIPKITTKYLPPSGKRRVLNVLQLIAIIMAIGLVLSGWYLMSITTVESLYPLPSRTISYHGVKETFEGETFNTRIYTWVPPPEDLTINRVAVISVKCLFINDITKGVYNIAVRYLEFSPINGTYIPAEKNYTGRFLFSGIGSDYLFSGFVSVPSSIGLAADQQPIPRDIIITVLTNVTSPVPPNPFRVESSLYANTFVERQPYRTVAFSIFGVGVLILGAALTHAILIQLVERRWQK